MDKSLRLIFFFGGGGGTLCMYLSALNKLFDSVLPYCCRLTFCSLHVVLYF